MFETYQFKLPYLQAAQAQKHVTVNEALSKLDALAQLRVQSRTLDIPTAPIDGLAYIVPPGATGLWAAMDGLIALFLNGGWEFVSPISGWVAWVLDEAAELRFDGAQWDYAVVSVDPNLGMTQFDTIEFDHTITAGPLNTTSVAIPNNSVVFGVSGRVIQTINGPAAFSVGVNGYAQRFDLGIGGILNTSFVGLDTKARTYFADTPLVIESQDADLIDGVIRLCIHKVSFQPPAAV